MRSLSIPAWAWERTPSRGRPEGSESRVPWGAPAAGAPGAGRNGSSPHPPREIPAALEGRGDGPAGRPSSRDTGFTARGKGAPGPPAGPGYEVLATIPGISSLSYFTVPGSNTTWQDVHWVSAHGRPPTTRWGDSEPPAHLVVLGEGGTRPQDLCAQLQPEAVRCAIWWGAALPTREERICLRRAQSLAGEEFADLAVLLAEHPTRWSDPPRPAAPTVPLAGKGTHDQGEEVQALGGSSSVGAGGA